MSYSPLDSRLYAPFLTTPAMAAVFADRAFVAAMLRFEAGLARAQARHGLVPAGLAAAIEAVDPDDFDLDALGAGTTLSAVVPVPFVKMLTAKLPRELQASVHLGATTQDVSDTALSLQMRAAFALLAADLAAILDGLCRLAETHARTPCIGRTYGQHAAPVSFGYKVAVWAAGIAELADDLRHVRDRACKVQLGGPVGTLAASGEHADAVLDDLALDLGLERPPIVWHTRRAAPVAAGHWLARLCGALGKMATDVAHLASTEVGEVAEPAAPGRGGSSSMPHKRNPVAATAILANAQAASGHAASLTMSMLAAHERPTGAWQAEFHSLATLFGLAAGACAQGRVLATGLTVDAAAMARNLDVTRGLVFADAAAAALAPSLGRAAALDAVTLAADRVRRDGITLAEALVAGGHAGADLRHVFDPGPAVAAAAARTARAVARVRKTAKTLYSLA